MSKRQPVTGFLTAIYSERDVNGNCYWAFRYVDAATGITIEAQHSGGESNIRSIPYYLANPDGKGEWNDAAHAIRFEVTAMKKREFQRLTGNWPYGGCSPEEMTRYIRKAIADELAK
jgi:hypothetical protein